MAKTKPPFATPLNWANPLNTGLILALPMWEGVGSKVFDLSGLGGIGTITNVTQGATSGWAGGRDGGYSLRFDGSDDYINMGDEARYDFGTSDFALCAWIYPRTSNTRDMILGKDSATRGWIWILNSTSAGLNSAGQVALAWTADGTKFWNVDSAAGVVPTLAWTHLVCGRKGSTVLLYVNGRSVTFTGAGVAGGAATDTVRDTSVALEIGRRTLVGFTDPFDGGMDGVRIYNRMLSADEVWQLYVDPYQVFVEY